MFMGYCCDADKVMKIMRIRSFRSKIAQFKGLFECAKNNKVNTLNTCCHLLFFVFMCFCLLTSGYAMDVTLKWTPNYEPNLAGYHVFYRLKDQSYNFTDPYWETIDPTCTIYDLDETKTYYFVVRAFSTDSFQSSDSNEACLKSGAAAGN